MTGRPSTALLRARVVLPIRRPPIADGAVLVSGDCIAAVGPWRDLRDRTRGMATDLGDVVLLPGLINAHCHLNYTHMAGLFPPPRSFCDWIKCITTEKSQWDERHYLKSWLDGAGMLVRHGTTAVADIEVLPHLLPQLWPATPLRVRSFIEMTGIRSRRTPQQVLEEALAHITPLPEGHSSAHLSPHAPYSTRPELLTLSAQAASRQRLLVATHVAESAAEFEMFMQGRGEMHDWLQRSERDMSDCGRGSPVRHLARAGLLSRRLLAIHTNYLAPGDADLLARRGVSVVHCPRSHAYFRHEEFPRRKLAKAGVNVALGTDSLASVRVRARQKAELSMFDEMRAFAAAQPGLRPEAILAMATTHGARALHLEGRAGELRRGAFADFITVPFTGETRGAAAAVAHHRGPVHASMIAGRWAIAPELP